MSYSIKQLAVLAGVSVRTLHFYDEQGLLRPSFVEKNGYRKYEHKELVRLQQILFFKELDFSLEDIKKILDASGFDATQALRDHKKMILLKRVRLERLLKTIDVTIKKMTSQKDKKDIDMKDTELYDSFDESEMEQYKEEAKQRWGNTDAYRQSQERTKHWKKEDYAKVKKSGEDLMRDFVQNLDKGHTSPEIQALVQRWRDGINVFYDTTLPMCRNLAMMYVEDPRFTAYYEKFSPGFALFMRDAIFYYCDTQEK